MERKARKKIESFFMTNQKNKNLPDLMSQKDSRGVPIKKVGISELKVPLKVRKNDGSICETVGVFGMFVGLNASERGTHMSRFSILLNDFISGQECLDFESIESLTRKMKDYLDSESSYIDVEFSYFKNIEAPVTSIAGIAPFTAGYKSSLDQKGNFSLKTYVSVTGQTCCPCSKEISDYDEETKKGRGAHSQHGHVFIEVENTESQDVSIDALIEVAQSSLSAPSYPILKRQDERIATISAYENPCFVEDVIRGCATRLRKFEGINSFYLEVVNDEVIHFHKAKASLYESLT